MPKHLTARPPLDATEERQVRTLTHSMHAPADWIVHATFVAHSWDGLRTNQIAEALRCHPQTVRERLHACNERGFEGLGMKPGGGRTPRLSEQERSTILALIQLPPPGKPTYELSGELQVPDPKGASEWTLDALTAMAPKLGIQVARSSESGAAHLSAGRDTLAPHPGVGQQHGSRLRPQSPTRAQIGARSTQPPEGATVRGVDSLRRTGACDPAYCPAGSGLVTRRPPDHGTAQLRPGTTEGLGLWGALGA
jgi:transposase